MTKYRYNHEKNIKLLHERGIGFEEIIQSIADGNLLDIKLHHNQEKYKGQKILYVRMIAQVYAVLYIKGDKDAIFLNTLFPSRKAKKEFLGNKK
ncbi:MAG: hypothetical protein AB8U88_04515 [Rickettsia conorii subsp. raoultii]|uniref:Toxin n=1 Tax=Rickettsia conorii subsp. raoultii TaxID=369822 RepID=A0A9N7BT09_RICCR|nr:hypothetical protein [Rickettsia conorii]AJQ51965.1 hypothetical protein UQ52_04535 [Rickettsia conorii subsp. raoultii]APZ30202.1 hypothetical protein RRIM16_04870 [Rickettsia conorii subsp. raoultii]URW77523.1 hypothetical protein NBT09_05910 [Rickettsia conorii subsp. raoultii]